MKSTLVLFLLLISGCCWPAYAQTNRIRVKDVGSKAAVPFAAIKLGSSGQGVIADLDGMAVLPSPIPNGYIEVTALGYEAKRFIGELDSVVYLRAKKESLKEVVVKPDYDKLRRIIRNAVDRRNNHNPERYDWYQCKVYYKMLADGVQDSSSTDTSKDAREFAEFLEQQHIIVSETYSRRSYQRPQKLQEEVLATRFSGFKTPLFTMMVTDILPFHCYTDYLKLNGHDYRNPVSPGAGSWFQYNLKDELLQGGDTVWVISYYPKKAGQGLKGIVYIHSKDYAIEALTGSYYDTVLGSALRIEQHYIEVEGKWFPQQLNYVYDFTSGDKKDGTKIRMQGTSRIDSVSFSPPVHYRFDKLHTVKLEPAASRVSDSSWAAIRPQALDTKEARTYVFMDSAMDAMHADKFLDYLPKLVDGKVPIGPVDLDLGRLYRYNSYEGSRVGLGLQTGDKISKWLSVGGWGGYGTRDKEWKWGGFAEAYLDKYKEARIKIAYDHDIRDPGRIQLHKELDNTYVRNYLIGRADAFDAYSVSITQPFGYLSTELGVRHEDVSPKYAYNLNWEGRNASDYSTDEVSLRLRYAFAERSAPMFGRYFSTSSDYPICYAKAKYGVLDMAGQKNNYIQAIGAVAWQKHIARIGLERWLLVGGKLWSDDPLPLGKLFAGPGVRADKTHLYIFGGLQTVYPYNYYTDAFVYGSWKHDFDWRMYKLEFGTSASSMPGVSLVYNGMWGKLSNASAHQHVAFSVPDAGYHEGGVMVRDILRVKYFGLAYIGLSAGYFYPLQAAGADPGVYVLGLSLSL
jgi:hypothetical protein